MFGIAGNEEPVDDLRNSLNNWVEREFGTDKWGITFDQRKSIFLENPSEDYLIIDVKGAIKQKPPEKFVEEGVIHNPLHAFDMSTFARTNPRRRPITQKEELEVFKVEEENFFEREEVLRRVVTRCEPIQGVNTGSAIEDFRKREENTIISDAYGNEFTEIETKLAINLSKKTVDEDELDVLISFDFIRQLIPIFRYSNTPELSGTIDDPEGDDDKTHVSEEIECSRFIDSEYVSEEEISEIDQVYVHQNESSLISEDYTIPKDQIKREYKRRSCPGRG